jgi:hypothetical protein
LRKRGTNRGAKFWRRRGRPKQKERSRNKRGREVLKIEKREIFENREGRTDLRNNWRREPLPFSITTATCTASHHSPPPACNTREEEEAFASAQTRRTAAAPPAPLPSLGSENEKGEKGEEPPAVVRIAPTSATPEPLPAAAVLPVIDNNPCTVRNRRRSKNRYKQRKPRRNKERRRTAAEPPSQQRHR